MGNDTKLGVLVGLVIVVVASVYFYGSSEEDGDLFVSPPATTGPPQIPDGPNESLETARRSTLPNPASAQRRKVPTRA